MDRPARRVAALPRQLRPSFAGIIGKAAAPAVAIALSTTAAFAADKAADVPSEAVLLAQLILLIAVGRLLGEIMTRLGQPSVMGMLLAGILLGPSLFGALWPDLQQAVFPRSPAQKTMLDGIAQLGVLLLLLLTGMETDLQLVRKVGKAALPISITGVAVPFACGFTLGELMPETLMPQGYQRVIASLFLGTALSISSIKIVAAIVREMGFTRRDLGQIIVGSAICEDSIGWVIIAITFGLAEAGTIDAASVTRSVLGTAAFLVASFTIGRRLVFLTMRWANDSFESDFPVVSAILVIMGVMALTTHFIGVHTVLGAFVAGVLIGESPILSKHVDEQLRGLILAFFMPVFFGSSGLSTDLTILRDPMLAIMALVLIAVASFGKFAGAFLGGKIGGLTRREALALACAMNARGSTEVIVASLGLSMGALSHDLFTIIVAMAVITTMAMPPMLRWSLARVPMRKDEKQRLHLEQLEAKEFVPNLERMLLAVDESPNGKLAGRLAGLLAGPRNLPTTVLALETAGGSGRERRRDITPESGPAQEARESQADATAAQSSGSDAQRASSVMDITVRHLAEPGPQAVAAEAKKGYGLLVIGIRNTRARSGAFHRDVAEIVSAFEGPVAIVAGKGDSPQLPASILVPVTGTETSRRAAEMAIAFARGRRCALTALCVASTGASSVDTCAQAHAIIGDVVAMGGRYGVKTRPAVRTDVAPDEAILGEARRSRYDLLVMGVSRRPGERLFFGDTAAAVFQDAPGSVLFLVS